MQVQKEFYLNVHNALFDTFGLPKGRERDIVREEEKESERERQKGKERERERGGERENDDKC